LEQRLLADPSNAGGWVLFARTTSILGDWRKAADAYQRAIDLGQKSSDVYAGYGEMLVMAADGVVVLPMRTGGLSFCSPVVAAVFSNVCISHSAALPF